MTIKKFTYIDINNTKLYKQLKKYSKTWIKTIIDNPPRVIEIYYKRINRILKYSGVIPREYLGFVIEWYFINNKKNKNCIELEGKKPYNRICIRIYREAELPSIYRT